MQLKQVQKASKSRVSTPPPIFVIIEVKKIAPHYFVVVRPQSNQNQQKIRFSIQILRKNTLLFMMISNWQKPFGLHGFYKNNSGK